MVDTAHSSLRKKEWSWHFAWESLDHYLGYLGCRQIGFPKTLTFRLVSSGHSLGLHEANPGYSSGRQPRTTRQRRDPATQHTPATYISCTKGVRAKVFFFFTRQVARACASVRVNATRRQPYTCSQLTNFKLFWKLKVLKVEVFPPGHRSQVFEEPVNRIQLRGDDIDK